MSAPRRRRASRRPLTSETITDEQIREMWRAGLIDSQTRNTAIRTYRGGVGEANRHAARARCAEISNARKSGKS